MDISKLKESLGNTTQNLGFLKDYSPLILPVIIVIVAIIIFLVTPFVVGGKLQEEIESESVSLGESIGRGIRDPVSKQQWKIEKEYQQAHAEDANEIEQIVDYSCKRELLSYGIFPELKDESSFVFEKFGNTYREALEQMAEDVEGKGAPTQAELDRYLENANKNISTGTQQMDRFGSRTSEGTQIKKRIEDALCLQKAQSAGVYLNPATLPGYEFWGNYEYPGLKQALEDCWYWQLAYWIMEDVITTIDQMNSGSVNILDAPVKRLLKISFGSTNNSQSSGRVAYVTSEGQGLVTPYTNKISNEEIDVVHFTLSTIVNNRAVMEFQKELCSAKEHTFRGFDGQKEPETHSHNQITILDVRLLPVNRDSEIHNLYRYGKDNSLVELELICEYIFDKDSYYPIKPDSVKEFLGEPVERETQQRNTVRRR